MTHAHFLISLTAYYNRKPQATDKGQAMRAFFSNVESIKTDMAEIRTLQREVISMHEKSKTIVKSKDMEMHREDMQVRVIEKTETNVCACVCCVCVC